MVFEVSSGGQQIRTIQSRQFILLRQRCGKRLVAGVFVWYRKSSEQGQPYASYAVAQMYDKGEYVSQSEETAQRYYKVTLSGFLELESKGQADDNLYYKLGAMYKKGLGTEIDIPKAIEYFEKSAENMWSTYQLGRLYLFGAEGLQKKRNKLWSGLQSPQMTEMSMHRTYLIILMIMKVKCLEIQCLVFL